MTVNIGLKLLGLMFVVVYIIDISLVVDEIKKLMWRLIQGKNVRYRYFRMKPFDCSLCMVWWLSLIYLFYIQKLGWEQTIFYSALNSYLSILGTKVLNIIYYIEELLNKIIE